MNDCIVKIYEILSVILVNSDDNDDDVNEIDEFVSKNFTSKKFEKRLRREQIVKRKRKETVNEKVEEKGGKAKVKNGFPIISNNPAINIISFILNIVSNCLHRN